MGKALYRVYRSKSFDEVVGQEHITDTLKNSVNDGTFSHAYLLTGPRGVGKTSVARILAHKVNGVPYPSKTPYVDIIEIDAASNRRIDEIRDLRERVVIAPTSLKFKVYIIDEVHMLTREAFNALLKTLEEPPEHAIFILATTDVHKVPDTIISRCIQFHFKLIPAKKIIRHLKDIAKKEKIEIEESALELIAEHSGGSFRDAIALLDQVRGSKKISREEIEKALGLSSSETIRQVLSAINEGDVKKLLQLLNQAKEEGVSENRLANQLALELRKDILQKGNEGLVRKVQLIDEILVSSTRRDPWASLEVALMKMTAYSADDPASSSNASKHIAQAPAVSTDKPKVKEKNISLDKDPIRIDGNDEAWKKILDGLKEKNKSLYAVARMARPEYSGSKLTLHFGFSFHYKQVKQAKNCQLLKEIIEKIQPNITEIAYENSSNDGNKDSGDIELKNITNIFGASEVLES